MLRVGVNTSSRCSQGESVPEQRGTSRFFQSLGVQLVRRFRALGREHPHFSTRYAKKIAFRAWFGHRRLGEGKDEDVFGLDAFFLNT